MAQPSNVRLHANAADAFIVNTEGKVLVLRRRLDDVHSPGQWDLPGGRLDPGENPYEGVRREACEEIGLDLIVEQVIDVDYFTRDDGQVITFMVFFCRPCTEDVRLSEEHIEYRWVTPQEAVALQPCWFPRIVERYERWMRGAR